MFPRRAFGWISASLALGVALCSGLAPSMRHTHANGGLPHDHHAPAGRPASPCEHCAIEDATPHWHVCWFGVQFTFTAPSSTDGEGPTDRVPSSGGSTTIVSLTDLPLVVPSEAAGRILPPEPAAPLSVAASRPVAAHRPAMPDTGARLCDIARHERSGVQLI